MYSKIGHFLNMMLVVALITFGLIYYATSGDNPFVQGVIEFFTDPSNKIAIVLLLIVVATSNLVLLAGIFVPDNSSMSIPVVNENGRIDFELSAIEEVLTRAIQEREEVHDCRVQITVSEGTKEPIKILATVSVWDKATVTTLEVTEQLQTVLKKRFEEVLLIDGDVETNIRIRKIPEPSRKAEAPISEIEPPSKYGENGYRGHQ